MKRIARRRNPAMTAWIAKAQADAVHVTNANANANALKAVA
jgi:hypothetical protein